MPSESILKKDFINILLTAKSEKEVAKKAKKVYLQWDLYGGWVISEKIESLIRNTKQKTKEVQNG
ncbi:hypothetical protein RhiirB3_461906 [Rhizophagus irregularis]|nr:hypothetical protein RhiirB3_461906 [Rhizophagus irregularis]